MSPAIPAKRKLENRSYNKTVRNELPVSFRIRVLNQLGISLKEFVFFLGGWGGRRLRPETDGLRLLKS